MKNRVAPYHQRANRRDTDATRIALRAHPSGPASTASGHRIDIVARPGDSDEVYSTSDPEWSVARDSSAVQRAVPTTPVGGAW